MASDTNKDKNQDREDEDGFNDTEQTADTYGWGEEKDCNHGHATMFCILALVIGIAVFFYLKYCRETKVEIPDDWQKSINKGHKQVRKVVNQTVNNASSAVDQTVRKASSAVDDATSRLRDSVQQILD